jgi:integrase
VTAAGRAPGRTGLLAKLMAEIRPEFRVERLTIDRKVHRKFRVTGRTGRAPLSRCTGPGCGFGVRARGLCAKHYRRWQYAGYPDLSTWIVPVIRRKVELAECSMPSCALWVENESKIFCCQHDLRWRAAGRPDPDEFTGGAEYSAGEHVVKRKEKVDLGDLPPQLKLEFQYAAQLHHDTQGRPARPYRVLAAVRQAQQAGVTSLLDSSEEEWRHAAGRGSRFLLNAREAVEALRDGTGWETEYARDIWRLHLLPGVAVSRPWQPRPRARLRFDRITQPWLRDLAKRWVRLRLVAGLSISAVRHGLDAVICFSDFLTNVGVEQLADVDRSVLERYLAWVNSQPVGPGEKRTRIGGVNLLFQAVRRHGWDDTLPTTATFFPGDSPPVPERISRNLAEYVMAQIESPANLKRWADPAGRLVTVILIQCGLRISSAVTLDFDCLLHDGQGAPYLRYFNTKMRREAAVPISQELESQIVEQQRRILQRWPDSTSCLFPRLRGAADGSTPLAPATYRRMLRDWLAVCDVRDESGRPVRLTPHQWRHTFATRLINRDVPQEVIRVLLDHESSQMTSHYAKITDQTVRRHWEQATKVNVNGERVSIAPDGPLAQAQWAKTRYAMATQTLSNGYCGLPIQKSCPHANACLTCPVFITGPEFLPELRQQRHRTLTLVEVSEGKGQTRVTEMNQQVLTNLDRMISEIENDEDSEAADAG